MKNAINYINAVVYYILATASMLIWNNYILQTAAGNSCIKYKSASLFVIGSLINDML